MDESIIKETQAILQPLIAKPSLRDKHLQKPPFRFLHDIFTNMKTQNNFPPDGVFPEAMLSSENIKSKDDKMAFLNIAIKFVTVASGEALDVNSQKVVQGHDPENTNTFLQALARACNKKDELDMPSIVAQFGGGEAAPEPAAEPEPAADGGDDAAAAEAEAAAQEAAKRKQAEADAAAAAASAATAAEAAAAEAAPEPAPASSGGGGTTAAGLPIDRDVVDLPTVSDPADFIDPTSAMLGALIQKPKMAPKLLKKPPFRYIHDIVTSLKKVTGFPAELYTEDELNSQNVKDNPSKLKFLKKLIEFVAVASGTDLSHVNPKKIASGLEPENTNILLQQMAVASASGVSCRAVMDKIMSSRGVEGADPPAAEEVAPAPAAEKPAAEAKPAKSEAPKPRERPTKGPTKAMGMPKLPLQDLQKEKDANSYAAPAASEATADTDSSSKLKRPKTARRAPPRLASNLVADGDKEEDKTEGGPTGVILDGEEVQDDDEDEAQEEPEQLAGFGDPIESDGQHGKLVGAILNAQAGDKKKEEEGDNFAFKRLRSARNTKATTLHNMKNINDLRQKIQKICQSVNPLGKCIDFVYEDMDQMTKELAKWRQSYTTYLEKYEEERAVSTQMLEPLTNELSVVTQDVIDATKKIHTTKAMIKRNDETILQLLESHSNV